MVICLEQGANDLYNPADASVTPLSPALLKSQMEHHHSGVVSSKQPGSVCSCFIKIANGLTFLVLADPGCRRKRL